jgi:hypothetical protein
MLNSRRKMGSKFLADAGFVCDKTPVIVAMLRDLSTGMFPVTVLSCY